MNLKTKSKFVRVRDRQLSLWQSSVAENLKKDLQVTAMDKVLAHPMMQAVNNHILLYKQKDFKNVIPDLSDEDLRQAFISYLFFEMCVAKSTGAEVRLKELDKLLSEVYRPFSDYDPNWTGCQATYEQYDRETNGVMLYNDWTIAGDGDINYGVIGWTQPNGEQIGWTLPNDGRVAIIGDWGTGLHDAACLLNNILRYYKPSAIIHLGDIYYSGTPTECTDSFVGVFNAMWNFHERIPVFTIPGNHDYYAWGKGFYPMLPQLATGEAVQEASYFCLRTADNCWQFLAMDTGYQDSDPDNALDSFITGPGLQPTEIEWHQDKLQNFSGSTILLSHHQLFSANAAINGRDSIYNPIPYFNAKLYSGFWNFLQSNVSMWIWGHEHNLVLYENGIFGLPLGRLVGCSAYEELSTETPNAYDCVYPEVTYELTPPAGQLGTNTGSDGQTYYNHGFAIVDLKRANPTDPINITYYQYPSWFADDPAGATSSEPVTTEAIATPSPPTPSPVTSGMSVYLMGQEGLFITALYAGNENYPTMNTQAPVTVVITNNNGDTGQLSSGDTVTIMTTEEAASNYSYLGAWEETWCYYYTSGYDKENWIIYKQDTSTSELISTYDEVYFVNVNSNSVLMSYPSKLNSDIYMTAAGTSSNPAYYWMLIPSTDALS